MSGMLASVNSLDEALLVSRLGVDIIDLKQPSQGALGALDTVDVRCIVECLGSNIPISATIGDLPMQATLLSGAVESMIATGVDYVKIGFFPDGDWDACIEGLTPSARQGHALIAVLFADTQPDFTVIPSLAKAGFRGVMLDTQDKSAGSLTQCMPMPLLQAFVDSAKSYGLLTGLAGSLRLADVGPLSLLGADYLGFRGALCRQHDRVAALDDVQIRAIRQQLEVCHPIRS